MDGYEADDIAYSIWYKHHNSHKINLYTADSDWYFMVNEHTEIQPITSKSKHITKDNFSEQVSKKCYIPYNAYALYLALFGKTSDNIKPNIKPSVAEGLLYKTCKKFNPSMLWMKSLVELAVNTLSEETAGQALESLNALYPIQCSLPPLLLNNVDFSKVVEWGRALGNPNFGEQFQSERIKTIIRTWYEDGLLDNELDR